MTIDRATVTKGKFTLYQHSNMIPATFQSIMSQRELIEANQSVAIRISLQSGEDK